ncbi:MAG: hypothetical protein QXT34_02140 [Candidatus Aenigmatarchaeota archaeon]
MVKFRLFKLQTISIEFLISFTIFTAIILFLFSIQMKKTFDILEYYEDLALLKDLDTIDVLLDIEGKPSSWNVSYFEVLGLRSDGKIDMEKVNYIKEIGYENVKKFLNIRYDFCIQKLEIGNCSFDNSEKIFVRKKIVPIKSNETVSLEEIKLVVWK